MPKRAPTFKSPDPSRARVAGQAHGDLLPVATVASGNVAYEAELEIEPTRVHDVEAWLPGHVAEILKLPGFESVETFKIGATADGWIRRKNVYRVTSREHLDRYLNEVAPQMSARLKASFGDSVRMTRRILVPEPLSQSLPLTVAGTATGVACMNCETVLVGKYCHRCGQRHEPHIHSVLHFAREATENLTHADSRLWRSLWALVAKPGVLTRAFMDGQRARYLPPVRLYLVISLAFFIALGASSLTREKFLVVDQTPDSAAQLEAAAAEIEAKAAGAAASTNDKENAYGDSFKKELAAELAADLRASAAAARGATTTPPARAATTAAKPRDPAQWCDRVDYGGPWRQTVEPRLRAGCRKSVLDDGAALKSAFVHQMPRAMFVLLPLLALLMLLMYWRPRRYYVEHLLFFVHIHSALFLVMLARLAVSAIPMPPLATTAIDVSMFIYITWYLYQAMRRTYAQGHARTIGKFFVLGFLYFTLASLVLVFTLMYSVATL